jgi:hypothetical protein
MHRQAALRAQDCGLPGFSPVGFRVIGVAYREEGDAISDIVCTVGVEISR